MRKLLLCISALLMAVLFTFQPISAAAAVVQKTADEVSSNEFFADIWLGNLQYYGFSDGKSDMPILEYLAGYKGLTDSIADDLKSDVSSRLAISAWELEHIVKDGPTVSGVFSESAKYEIILIELLKETLKNVNCQQSILDRAKSSTDSVSELMDVYLKNVEGIDLNSEEISANKTYEVLSKINSISKHVNSLYKNHKNIQSIDIQIFVTEVYGNLSAKEYETITKSIIKDAEKIDKLTIISKDISESTKFAGYVFKAVDLLEKYCTYLELNELSENYLHFLDKMSDTANNTVLSEAIQKVKRCMENGMSAADVIFEIAQAGADAVFAKQWELWKDSILLAFPWATPIWLAFTTTITITDFAFNTEDKVEQVYLLIAFHEVYEAVQLAYSSVKSWYENMNAELYRDTEEDRALLEERAGNYVAGFNMLFVASIKDAEYAADFYEKSLSGIVNRIFVNGKTRDEIENAQAQCKEMQANREQWYASYLMLAYKYYENFFNQSEYNPSEEQQSTNCVYGYSIHKSAFVVGDVLHEGDISIYLINEKTGEIVKQIPFSQLTLTYNFSRAGANRKISVSYNGVTQNIYVDVDYGAGYCGDLLEWVLEYNGTLKITGIGDMWNWTYGKAPWYALRDKIVSLSIGDRVTSIGDYAFFQCSSLRGQLKIPNSVTSIGECAFHSCSGFTGSLTIPDSVTRMGDFAFAYCSGFTGRLTMSNSVTDIGSRAFRDCTGFTGKLTIPYGVTRIGDLAFGYCSGFTGSLTIPDSVTSIGARAFCLCSGFTGSLTIPDSVTSIGDRAFYECSGFTRNLTIPNSVTSIGDYAFWKCSGFTGSLTIPDSVTSIGDHAFAYCSGFTGNLTISNSVTRIEDSAFSSCSGFTGSLTIPKSVTSIGYYAFLGCSGFTDYLIIPSRVRRIDAGAFGGCGNTDYVCFYGKEPFVTGKEIFNKSSTLYYLPENTGWITSSAYDAETGTWNGYTLKPFDADSVLLDAKQTELVVKLQNSTEYRLGEDGEWQTSPFFRGLTPDTGYFLYTRSMEDGTVNGPYSVRTEKPAEFLLADQKAEPGDLIRVDLTMNSHVPVDTVVLRLFSYPANLVTFEGFADQGATSAVGETAVFDAENGTITLSYPNAAVRSGKLCSLLFRVKDDAPSGSGTVGISSLVKCGETECPSAVLGGSIRVIVHIPGDIDCNGSVDIRDVVLLMQTGVFPELYPTDYSGTTDLNGDGSVDVHDAAMLLQYSLFPELYPLA